MQAARNVVARPLFSDRPFRPVVNGVVAPVCDAEWPSDCDSDGTEALRSPASMPINLFEMK